MTKFILIFILIASIYNCSQKTSVENNFNFYPNFKDNSEAKKVLLRNRDKEYRFFNLTDITKGSNDSIEIRIWPHYAFNLFKNCFVFRFNSNEHGGLHYNSYTMPITTSDGIVNKWEDRCKLGENVFVVKQIEPKCGWRKFYDSVIYFKLSQLPTQFEINNFKYKATLDGYGYDFEIATKNSYRIISYGNPTIYVYEECKLISGFIEMLQRQLGKDFDWPLINK